MTSVLRAFDIFNTKFYFTIDKRRGYSTVLGSFLTLVSAVVFVALFIILGKDFLYKENARTSNSVFIADRIEKVNLRDFNLTIAISLKKNIDKVYTIDLDGQFFWSDYTYSHRYFNQTEESFFTNFTSIRLKPCDNLTYQPSMNFSSEFYCLELPPDAYIGEEKDSSFNLKYTLFNCEKKYPMFYPGAKCNSIQTLTEEFKEGTSISYMFNIYYPVLYIDPRDKANPAKVNYELLSFPFDFNLQRADKLHFHKTVVNDDKGWWFEENYNETYWTVESKDYAFNYKTNEDLVKKEASSKLYEFDLSVSLKTNYFTRSYMKIQDVLAVVATILKILVIVFDFICMLLNNCLIHFYIFTKLFTTVRSSYSTNSISAYSNSNVSKMNLINAQPSTVLGSKVTPLNLTRRVTSSAKVSFDLCFAFRRSFGAFCFRSKEKPYLLKYDQGHRIVREKIELEYYLKLIYDVIILQKSMFNEAQYQCLNYLKKVNLFNQQEVESYFNVRNASRDEDLLRCGNYFANQLEKKESEKAKDKFIFNKLDESFKAKIFVKKVD